MIYIDTLQPSHRFGESAKMISDNGPDELLRFGEKIGLYKPWLKQGVVSYFDVTARKREQAIKAGARAVSRGEYVEILKRLNNK